jgi:hypothetical protein
MWFAEFSSPAQRSGGKVKFGVISRKFLMTHGL